MQISYSDWHSNPPAECFRLVFGATMWSRIFSKSPASSNLISFLEHMNRGIRIINEYEGHVFERWCVMTGYDPSPWHIEFSFSREIDAVVAKMILADLMADLA